MTIRDWIELTLLVVLTFIGIGRWLEARTQTEARTKSTLMTTEEDLRREHQQHGEEILRLRKRWHEQYVPAYQQVVERITTLEGQLIYVNREQDRQGADILRIWQALERRLNPREREPT